MPTDPIWMMLGDGERLSRMFLIPPIHVAKTKTVVGRRLHRQEQHRTVPHLHGVGTHLLALFATEPIETVAEIGPITVKPSPPQVEILAPESDITLPHTTPVRLQAVAFGNDLTPLANKQLERSVDGKGVGSGVDVGVRDLETGSHVAKVVAHASGSLSHGRSPWHRAGVRLSCGVCVISR